MKTFFCTLALLALFNSCTEPEESRFNKIARAYCECTGKLVDLNQKAAKLASDTTAQASFADNLRQIQEAYGKSKICNETIVAQFGKLNTAELDSLKIVLAAGSCPDLSKQNDLLKEMLGK